LTVLNNDYDLDLNSLYISSLTPTTTTPSFIVNSISTDKKQLLFQPNNAFQGIYTCYYQVTDNDLGSTTATVIVNITNSPPTCTQTTVSKTINKNTQYNYNIFTDFTCGDINEETLTPTLTATTIKGIASVSTSATYYLNYISSPNTCGNDLVDITISDSVNTIHIYYSITLNNGNPQGKIKKI